MMFRRFVFVVAAVVCSLASARSFAAGAAGRDGTAAHRHGPPALLLLNRKAVREDLKLTDEQAQRVHEALIKQITAFVDASDVPREERAARLTALRQESAQAAAGILTPEQAARFKQIRLQVQGARAFFVPETAQALSISAEQQQKMRAIVTAAHQEMARVFAEHQAMPEEVHKALAEMGQRTRTQVMEVLTETQKAQWKEMTGEPIRGDLHLWRVGAWGHRPHCQG
jgi:Spy/CpxP family protein refolding chaperone